MPELELGIRLIYKWVAEALPYGGTCVLSPTGETATACAKNGCQCSPALNEPLWAETIAMAAAYCQWAGGRIATWGELAWASNEFAPADPALTPIPNVPSKAYPWTRTCGLVAVATQAAEMSCSGSTCTWKPLGAPCANCYSPASFIAALAANTTGSKLIYCAFDAKPTCM